jgi:hypothetical protein
MGIKIDFIVGYPGPRPSPQINPPGGPKGKQMLLGRADAGLNDNRIVIRAITMIIFFMVSLQIYYSTIRAG